MLQFIKLGTPVKLIAFCGLVYWRVCVRVYRINAVDRNGRAVVLGTADTATKALSQIKAAFGEYPRAWITDEHDEDVSLAALTRAAEGEQST